MARSAAVLLFPDAALRSRLTKAQERALRRAVRGRVYVPGNRGYDAARVVFNRRWDSVKPPAVVRVRDVDDVRAVVRWADRYDIPLVSRSGGHGYNGNSTSADAVVVDVGALDFIRFADGIATIGPAAPLGRVYEVLARRGVTVPAGSCPTVAIGGLALGGGMGLAGRAMGLTCDRLRSIDVVTADGRRRRVSGDDDLFWALRGGGGSFGIVTALRLRTRRVDRAAYFRINYPRAAREEALAAWDALAPRAPRALTAILTLSSSGATAFGQYLGSEAALRRLIAPLGGSPTIGSADYLTVQRRWGGSGSGRTTFAASSLYVEDRLSARGRRAFVEAADTGAGLILDAYGGAINAVRRSATAFPHRDARFSVQILSYTSPGTAKSRVRRARALIDGYGSGAYANYPDPDLSVRDYYGSNLARLRRIKREVDPANRFRPRQGIR
ncbi:MAG TPA: FAD-binding oxidoreductase [Solirubrobacter sp.]|nr:FAD-binding oxidoreductase [Solirubrobacter sp.]